MAFLFLVFTTVLTLCVVGLIVLALASILASVRDDWKLKKPARKEQKSQAPQHPSPTKPRALKSLLESISGVPGNLRGAAMQAVDALRPVRGWMP